MLVLSRLRRARKAPLAAAAILATPLFFVGLMAFSLALEKPSVHVSGGTKTLGDPTAGNEASIWLLSFAPAGFVLLVGIVAVLLSSRFAVILPALGTIAVSLVLRASVGGWEDDHTARYPLGIDLIPKSDPGDLALRGEWEQNARRTAEQIGFWTIMLAILAIAIVVLLEVRRRRRRAPLGVAGELPAAAGPHSPR